MRAKALICGLLLAMLAGSTAWAETYAPSELAPRVVATLDCVSAVDTPESDVPTAGDVVMFGRVAIPRDMHRSTLAPYTGRGTFNIGSKPVCSCVVTAHPSDKTMGRSSRSR